MPAVATVTPAVVMLNVAWDWPARTVTPAGTVAAPFVLASVTVIEAGAAALRVTVPVEGLPPVTPAGRRDRVVTRTGGVTVITPIALPPLAEAVIFAVVFAVTAVVVTVNEALIWPAATVTDAGTLAIAALLLESDTVTAAEGAASKYTVPVAL